MNTPWGKSDSITEYAEGITFVTTASHGGFYLSAERVQQIDPDYRKFAAQWSHGWGDRWYEEDCAALAVVTTWPSLFGINPKDLPRMKRRLDSYIRTEPAPTPLLERVEELREEIRNAHDAEQDNDPLSSKHDALWHALQHMEHVHHWLQEANNV